MEYDQKADNLNIQDLHLEAIKLLRTIKSFERTPSLPSMAILSEVGNKYKVRIKRVRDGSYFEEYIKLRDRGILDTVEVD